ncbi:hypothetical protein [Motilimonas pumila]|uniref:Type III secretion chaperone SycN n=1 Tax=Motilimonas pumila TaxID=2303987 RepID=A0A418YDZ4_9GAMM|nr:hypothetical protein [Motilimonas pumila]RJG42783.1 hypothetical protein D1Z90_11885 [Motilimonas pumila]
MVNDWRVDLLSEFVEGFGLNGREALASGELMLNFADGDQFHINLVAEDDVDLLLSHEVMMADQGGVMQRALAHNHFSKVQSYKANAHFYQEQLVLKLRLYRHDLSLVALEQALTMLRQTSQQIRLQA